MSQSMKGMNLPTEQVSIEPETKRLRNIKKRSVSGVVSYTARTFFLQIIALVATGLLSLYLSPEEFGVYFIVTAVIGIFTFLSDVGLAAALIQQKAKAKLEELRTTFTVQQILALFIVALIIGLTPLWRQFTGLDERGLELLYALAISFVLASLKTIPSILLERKLEFGKLVIPQIVEHILFYSIAVYLAYSGWGVRSYTVAVLVRSIAGVATIYWIQWWPIGFALSKKAFKKLIGFGIKFQANDFLARLKDDLYIVVLARFLDTAQMGYIGWAKRWSMFPYQFSVNNVVAVTFPTYSRLQEHKDKLSKAVEKSIYFITLVIFPILVGMSVMAYPLTVLIQGYAKWQPALPALYLFAVNIGWAAMTSPLTNTLNAIGHIDKTLKLMIWWTSLTWLLTPLGLKWFGFTGVALVAAVVASTSVIAIYLVKQVLTLRFMEQIWRQAIASGVMGVILLYLQPQWQVSWSKFVTGIGMGVVIYGAITLVLGKTKLVQEIKSLRSN